MATTIKKSKDLTLTDRLSRLTFVQAVQLLGGDDAGKKLLYAGGRMAVENIEEQVRLQGDLFRLSLPNEGVIVTITLRADKEQRLLCNCDSCDNLCEHIGAALSLIRPIGHLLPLEGREGTDASYTISGTSKPLR